MDYRNETHVSRRLTKDYENKKSVIARAEGLKQSLNVAGSGIASHPSDARNDVLKKGIFE